MRSQRYMYICAVLIWLIFSPYVSAQTTENPDISFIGDVRISLHNDRSATTNDYGKLAIGFHEIEVAATGYLNPYARADIYLGMHGVEGPFEVEEASMSLLRWLPANFQLKAGQYLVDFGKLNTQHPHQWSWMDRPLMHQELFGDDGLRDVGLQLSTLIPVGSTALTLSANLLRNGNLGGHHHHEGDEHGHDAESDEHRDIAFSGRAMLFSPVTKVTSIELGLSVFRAEFDPAENRYATILGTDGKLKWKPDMYQSVSVITELVMNQRTVETHDGDQEVTSYGAFGAVDWQFLRQYNAGAFYDCTQEASDSEVCRYGYGAFAGFSLAEETTRFGLLFRHDNSDEFDAYNTALLQVLWSLGPHKPHQF